MKRFLSAILAVLMGFSGNAETVVNYVRPTSSLDTYPVTLTRYNKGGWMSWVTNYSQLLSTDPIAGIPTARRELGMLVPVNQVTNVIWYQLQGSLTNWVDVTPIAHVGGIGYGTTFYGSIGMEILNADQVTSDALIAAYDGIAAPNNYAMPKSWIDIRSTAIECYLTNLTSLTVLPTITTGSDTNGVPRDALVLEGDWAGIWRYDPFSLVETNGANIRYPDSTTTNTTQGRWEFVFSSKTTKTVPTLLDLFNVDPRELASEYVGTNTTFSAVVNVSGYYNSEDSGGGTYLFTSDQSNTNALGGKISVTGGAWLLMDETPNARQFGAKGDGATDDAASFSALAWWCQHTGKAGLIPQGNYLSSRMNVLLTNNLTLSGDGLKTRITPHIYDSTTTILWQFSADVEWSDTISAVATNWVDLQSSPTSGEEGRVTKSFQVTTASNHDLAIGDVVKVYSMDLMPGGFYFSSTGEKYRAGEYFSSPITQTTTNVLTFGRPPVWTYTDTNYPQIVKLSNHKLKISGVTFEEGADPGPTFARSGFLFLRGLVNPEVSDIHFDKSYGHGLSLNGCYGQVIDNISGIDLATVSTNSRFGYVVSDRACGNGVYTRLSGRGVRHVFTTIGQGVVDGNTNDFWYDFGGCMFATVSGTGDGNSNSSFDTHEDSYGVTFDGLTVTGTYDGNNSYGAAISIRGSNGVIRNAVVDGAADAFSFSTVSSASTNTALGMVAENITARNLWQGAFRVTGYSTNWAGPATIKNSSFHIRSTPGAGQTISSVLPSAIHLGAALGVEISNCSFDIEGTATLLNVFPQLNNPTNTPAGPIAIKQSYIRFKSETNEAYQMSIVGTTNFSMEQVYLKLEDITSTTPIRFGETSSGVGSSVNLRDVTFDLTGNTANPNLITLQGAALYGDTVSIVTGGDPNAMGWFLNGDSALSPVVAMTNVVVDAATGTPVDTIFNPVNIKLDYKTTATDSRYQAPSAVDTTLYWPVQSIRLNATLTSNAAVTLPAMANYRAGQTIEIMRESAQPYTWTITPFAGDTIDGLSTVSMTYPGQRMSLVAGISGRWLSNDQRARQVRTLTSGNMSVSDLGVYYDTSGGNIAANLPSVASATSATVLYVSKSADANTLTLSPMSGETVNQTTSLVLTATKLGVVLVKQLTSGYTNWMVVGTHTP